MALYEIAPSPQLRAVLASGAPAAGAKLYCWAAGGTSVAQNTYTTPAGITPNANPIIADSSGWFPPIFLLPLAYRMVCKTSDGATTLFDVDGMAGPNYSALTDSAFMLRNLTDPTKKIQFILSGISTGQTRFITAPDSDGTLVYTGLAQVVAGKTLTSVAVLQMAGPIQQKRGTDIVAANDITLPVNGDRFVVTGNTQINRISATGWQDGTTILLFFSGTPTIKHGQATGGGFNIIRLNTNADKVAASGAAVLQLTLLVAEWIQTN